jgi:hypothetical protein
MTAIAAAMKDIFVMDFILGVCLVFRGSFGDNEHNRAETI